MRNTPVIVFVNKLDREGRDPFDILDELEAELKINVRPLSWPINIGQKFKGVYNIYEQNLNLFTPNKQVVTERIDDLHLHSSNGFYICQSYMIQVIHRLINRRILRTGIKGEFHSSYHILHMVYVQNVFMLDFANSGKLFLYLVPCHFHLFSFGSPPFHKVQIFTLACTYLQGQGSTTHQKIGLDAV